MDKQINPVVEPPKLNLKGAVYTAPIPKLKVLKAFFDFEDWKTTSLVDSVSGRPSDWKPAKEFEDRLDIIVKVFDNPAVTVDSLLENMDLSELMPVYQQIFKWLPWVLNNGLSKMPKNAEPPEEENA